MSLYLDVSISAPSNTLWGFCIALPGSTEHAACLIEGATFSGVISAELNCCNLGCNKRSHLG